MMIVHAHNEDNINVNVFNTMEEGNIGRYYGQ